MEAIVPADCRRRGNCQEAVNASINTLLQSSDTHLRLVFPPGVYELKRMVEIQLHDERSLVVQGAGSGSTELRWHYPDRGHGGGIRIANSGNGAISVGGLRLRAQTNNREENAGHALEIDNTDAKFAGPVRITNCVSDGLSPEYWWQTGLNLVSCSLSTIRDFSFHGRYKGESASKRAGIGVWIHGDKIDRDSTDFTLDNVIARECEIGVSISGNIEGVTLNKVRVIYGYEGLKWHTSGEQPGLNVSDSHFNVDLCCLSLSGMMDAIIHDNDMRFSDDGLLHPGITSIRPSDVAKPWSAIYIHAPTDSTVSPPNRFLIHHNRISSRCQVRLRTNQGEQSVETWGIVIVGRDNASVTDNHVSDVDIGVWLHDSTRRCVVKSNTIRNTNNPIIASSENDVSDNIFS